MIQLKRGTSQLRLTHEDVLNEGQPFFETDTNKLYVGSNNSQLKDLKAINNNDNIENSYGDYSLRQTIDPQAGYENTARGMYGVALNQDTHANGKGSFAIGNTTKAGYEDLADYQVDHPDATESDFNTQNRYQFGLGLNCEALGKDSFAGGFESKSKQYCDFTWGEQSTTDAGCGTTFGTGNYNQGYNGFISGEGNHIVGSDLTSSIKHGSSDSFVTGKGNNIDIRSANPSLLDTGFAAGINNVIKKIGSAAFGVGNETTNNYQLVCGKYSPQLSDDWQSEGGLFVVGNGVDDSHRSKAFEVLNDGRSKAYGVPTENNDVLRLAEILSMIYPIGAIFMSTSSTNPGTYILNTTWVAWGSGRVPVGFDASNLYFNTVEKTGGEEEVQLTAGELPSHNHLEQLSINGSIDKYLLLSSTFPTDDGSYIDSTSIITRAKGGLGYVPTTNTGNNVPHNNLLPYITCYMWKRTA